MHDRELLALHAPRGPATILKLLVRHAMLCHRHMCWSAVARKRVAKFCVHTGRCCRWIQGKEGPEFLFVSPGLHDCFHDPDHYEYHARQLRHLVEHLVMLRSTVIYVDANPTTEGGIGYKILNCIFHVNTAGHALAEEFGMLMFSRQTMIVTGDQKDKSGNYPVHQTDEVLGMEVRYLLAWLGCILEHKHAGTLLI